MATRRPFSVIDANRRPNAEFSNETRAAVIASRNTGLSIAKAGEANGVKKSAAAYIIKTYLRTQDLNSAPRSGRPRVFGRTEEHTLLRIIREHPKWTFVQVKNEAGFDFSRSTLGRILSRYNLTHWRAKRRPLLLEVHRRKRLAFCHANLNTDWSRVIFSDECSVEKGAGKKQPWVWGHPWEKYDHDKISEYSKGNQGSVMVWGAIGLNMGRTRLDIMERDPSSPRGGYSTSSYLQTLIRSLLPIYEGSQFQQDGAPIHTSHRVTTWMTFHTVIRLLNWPPYSPDLSPIEHLWPRLKELIYELEPGLDDITDKKEQKRVLIEILPRCWEMVDDLTMRACLESMPDRINACILANGWQTRY
jgi:transposase